MLIRNVIWSANLSRTQNLRMSANMSAGEKCPNGNCRCERDWCECCFITVVGLPTPHVIDGGRTHHVASNMAGTSAPSTKNLLRDVSCCNSRVAVTRAPLTTNETLREEIMRITCTQTRDTNTNADVCANSSSLTATIKKIARCVARHQVACQNIADGGLS